MKSHRKLQTGCLVVLWMAIYFTTSMSTAQEMSFTDINGRIAFASDQDGDMEIYTIIPNGSEVTQLTFNDVDDTDPNWSPDGLEIAYVTYMTPTTRAIKIMASNGTNDRLLTVNPQIVNSFQPDWSLDGERIAFVSVLEDATTIFSVGRDGTGLSQVSLGEGNAYQPTWSPDGTKIAYLQGEIGGAARNSLDTFGLFIFDTLLMQTTALPVGPSYSNIDWSPNGLSIIFEGVLLYEVVQSINPNGTNYRTLLDVGISQSDPSWSSDGNYIIFELNGRDIGILSADGQQMFNLTNSPDVREIDPNWFRMVDTTTITPTSTYTSTPTTTSTSAPTFTTTPTPTVTFTPTETATSTLTLTPTSTSSPTASFTPTPTSTFTTIATFTPTATFTPAVTCTITAANSSALVSAINTANANGTSLDTICLTNSTYTFVSAQNSIALPSITTPIMIIGNGAILERGNGAPQFRLFNVTNSGSLTLQNLTIRNFNAGGGNGGAILSTGTVMLDGVTVVSNLARFAGGIHSSGTLTITDSTLSSNSSQENAGAIYLNSGTLTITDTTLQSNSARYGSGIYMNDGTATLTNVTMQSNNATEQGAGVYQRVGTLTITGGLFESNTARFGNGVYVDAGTATLSGVVMRNNTATEEGAAIYNRTGTLSVSGSMFDNNRARYGAAISNRGLMTVSGSIFTGNIAVQSGGAVYHQNANAQNGVVQSCFTGNTARFGGAVFSQTANFNAQNNWWGRRRVLRGRW